MHRHSAPPLLEFIIGGAQKCGTSALAAYLGQHPGIALPARKEAHVFDAPDLDPDATPAELDAKLARLIPRAGDGRKTGDATPISMFHPLATERIARYNPGMKWIIVLRDPVERAISHHAMSRARRTERLPLALAVLAEPLRLRRRDPAGLDIAYRKHSYVSRGRYARQLDRLFAHFPRENVLLLRSTDLRKTPEDVLARVCEFLDVDPMPAGVDYGPRFEGRYARPHRFAPSVLLLRWRLRHEHRALKERHRFSW